jgi:hypothetical protein
MNRRRSKSRPRYPHGEAARALWPEAWSVALSAARRVLRRWPDDAEDAAADVTARVVMAALAGDIRCLRAAARVAGRNAAIDLLRRRGDEGRSRSGMAGMWTGNARPDGPLAISDADPERSSFGRSGAPDLGHRQVIRDLPPAQRIAVERRLAGQPLSSAERHAHGAAVRRLRSVLLVGGDIGARPESRRS